MQQRTRLASFFDHSSAPLPQWYDEATGLPIADPWQGSRATHRLVAAILCGALTVAGIGCASFAPKPTIAHAGFIAASTIDVIYTQKALGAGAQELKPIFGQNPSVAKMAAVKMAGWSLIRILETTVEKEIGRELKWYERVLFWAVPTGLTAWASAHNFGVASEYSRRD